MVKTKKIICLFLLLTIFIGFANPVMAAVLVTVTLDNPAVDTIETIEDKLAEQNTDVVAGLKQGKQMLLERLEQVSTVEEQKQIQSLIDGYDKMIAEYTVYENSDVEPEKAKASILVSDQMANLLVTALLCNCVIEYQLSNLF